MNLNIITRTVDIVMKIKFMELSMSGVYHADINSCLMKIVRQIRPGADFTLYAERGHLAACRKRAGDMVFRQVAFPFFPAAVLRTILLRDLLAALYAVVILLSSRKKDRIFITNLLPLTHWALFVVNRFKGCSLIICLHGQLEAFSKGNRLRGTRLYFGLQRPLFRIDRHTRYVVPGEAVYKEVSSVFFSRGTGSRHRPSV